MNEHTLTVPAEYAKHFEAALTREIAFDVGTIHKDEADDLRSSIRMLKQDVALLDQFADLMPGESVELRTTDPDALAHAAETMADKVLGPKLADALNVGPMDGGQAPNVRRLLEPLAWAVDRAEQFHEVAQAKRERDREAVA